MTITVEIRAAASPASDAMLTAPAQAFLARLQRQFGPRVSELLAARDTRQAVIDAGERPDFLPETRQVRESDWQVTSVPADLADRRVEITGPTDRKMIINALNSGAQVFMADFEDSLSPTWSNVIEGQVNLRDAVHRTISLDSNGKHYALNDNTATLIVRPRGWHLKESHLLVDGQPMIAALVDFGLYLLHNAAELKKRGSGPYFYLPKMQSHLEARLWNDIFRYAEVEGVVAAGAIKVTVLIETIHAAFEMDEILYELRDYIVGQNCGRWDYIFSIIKTFNQHEGFIMPDRGELAMTRHFLRSYSQLLIKTCHRRGAYAIGGMAAQIPIRDDEEANDDALARVRADKEREASDGHDGTWVAHPALVPLAAAVFDEHMPGPNQLHKRCENVEVTADDLLQVPRGKITDKGLRMNISVAIQYIAAWLGGNGCVPINNLMEDAATAEISRSQIWQWVHHNTGILDTGRNVTYALVKALMREEMGKIREQVGDEMFQQGHYRAAASLLDRLTQDGQFTPFLTTAAGVPNG